MHFEGLPQIQTVYRLHRQEPGTILQIVVQKGQQLLTLCKLLVSRLLLGKGRSVASEIRLLIANFVLSCIFRALIRRRRGQFFLEVRVAKCIEGIERVKLLSKWQARHVEIVRMLMDEVMLALSGQNLAGHVGHIRHYLGHGEVQVARVGLVEDVAVGEEALRDC